MKSVQEIYSEKLNRLKTAAALGKPDRVPFAALGNAFCANHLGVKLSEFASNPELSGKTMIKSFTSLGDIDANQVQMFYPPVLSMIWLSNVKVPGVHLPDDMMWQVAEEELMKPEEYDTVINKGYNAFFNEFQATRLDNVLDKVVNVMLPYAEQGIKDHADAGVVVLAPFNFTTPFENFCGARSMAKFMQDMFRIPDKVQAAMDAAMPDILDNIRRDLRAAKPIGSWVGGWRSASNFVSPRLWQRFLWPYYKKIVETVIEEGVTPVLHLDSDWTRDLEFFKELPKAKCIISTDSLTDIYKVKEVLGGHMCIMGDVPAAKLSLGTPDEVYDYSSKLIKDLGPSGYILSSGCDIPSNAKPENVKAMISAATGK
jgi:hypothetical protein